MSDGLVIFYPYPQVTFCEQFGLCRNANIHERRMDVACFRQVCPEEALYFFESFFNASLVLRKVLLLYRHV